MQRPPQPGTPEVDDSGVQSLMPSSASVANLYALSAEHSVRSAISKRTAPAAAAATATAPSARPVPALFQVGMELVHQGTAAVIDDSFTRCFKGSKRVPWNWNVYLFPAWCAGVLLRYCVLFPLRLTALLAGILLVVILFPIAKACAVFMDTSDLEIILVRLLASAFVLSWSGVIRIHGLRPTPRPGQPAGVFVANHSSMIDFILLLQSHPYAVVGQKHPGWVGFMQDSILRSLHCIWFDRSETKNRKIVAERLRQHAHDPSKNKCPVLVFPEGTCVNNEYVVQFKKGVFELGVPINPIAIKYNKVFVDGYWNSREQSFAQHLFRLMTSWAVVADVWFLDPQTLRPGEKPEAFATRVQKMIAERAGLKAVDWDGYMKYWKPSERAISGRQREVTDEMLSLMGMTDAPPSPAGGAAGAGGASLPAMTAASSLSSIASASTGGGAADTPSSSSPVTDGEDEAGTPTPEDPADTAAAARGGTLTQRRPKGSNSVVSAGIVSFPDRDFHASDEADRIRAAAADAATASAMRLKAPAAVSGRRAGGGATLSVDTALLGTAASAGASPSSSFGGLSPALAGLAAAASSGGKLGVGFGTVSPAAAASASGGGGSAAAPGSSGGAAHEDTFQIGDDE